MKTIKLKRRMGVFYESVEEKELVFVLYEDVEGYVHYRYCTYDTDTYKMCAHQFFKDFHHSVDSNDMIGHQPI